MKKKAAGVASAAADLAAGEPAARQQPACRPSPAQKKATAGNSADQSGVLLPSGSAPLFLFAVQHAPAQVTFEPVEKAFQKSSLRNSVVGRAVLVGVGKLVRAAKAHTHPGRALEAGRDLGVLDADAESAITACGEALRFELDIVALSLAAACGDARTWEGYEPAAGCCGCWGGGGGGVVGAESRHEWDHGDSADTASARELGEHVMGAIRGLKVAPCLAELERRVGILVEAAYDTVEGTPASPSVVVEVKAPPGLTQELLAELPARCTYALDNVPLTECTPAVRKEVDEVSLITTRPEKSTHSERVVYVTHCISYSTRLDSVSFTTRNVVMLRPVWALGARGGAGETKPSTTAAHKTLGDSLDDGTMIVQAPLRIASGQFDAEGGRRMVQASHNSGRAVQRNETRLWAQLCS